MKNPHQAGRDSCINRCRRRKPAGGDCCPWIFAYRGTTPSPHLTITTTSSVVWTIFNRDGSS